MPSDRFHEWNGVDFPSLFGYAPEDREIINAVRFASNIFDLEVMPLVVWELSSRCERHGLIVLELERPLNAPRPSDSVPCQLCNVGQYYPRYYEATSIKRIRG